MSSTLISYASQISMDSHLMDGKRSRDDEVSETSSLTDTQFDRMKRMLQERRFSDASSTQMPVVPTQQQETVVMEDIPEHDKQFTNTEQEAEEEEEDLGSADGLSSSDSPQENVMEVLAKEITNLSLTEREQVFQEIHGVRELPKETPEYVQERHRAMQTALGAISSSKRKAYNLALEIDSSYVQDVDLRTRFLRCEMWDAEKAATRYVKHFQQKMDLFGKELLCKTIRQKHLSPDARQAVMEGSSQMPARDSRGRLVTMVFSNLNSNPSRPTKANLERIFYMTMVNTENEANQRTGSVLILGPISKGRWRAVNWQLPRLLEALPFRREAIHVCFDPSRRIFAKIAKYACERYTRQRTRLHTGKENCLGV